MVIVIEELKNRSNCNCNFGVRLKNTQYLGKNTPNEIKSCLLHTSANRSIPPFQLFLKNKLKFLVKYEGRLFILNDWFIIIYI